MSTKLSLKWGHIINQDIYCVHWIDRFIYFAAIIVLLQYKLMNWTDHLYSTDSVWLIYSSTTHVNVMDVEISRTESGGSVTTDVVSKNGEAV